MKNKQGLFITFEGVEGSGKTTQIKLLKHYLHQKGIPVLETKEPGGTQLGLELRRILLDSRYKFSSNYTEILFFTADRLEHIEQIVKPALKEGKIVICDRYVDSTRAYQEVGRNIPVDLVRTLIGLADLTPDITFLLDIDPQISILRARNRQAHEHNPTESKYDRFELEALLFHQKVRQRYLDQAKIEPDRIKVINVENAKPEAIFHHILTYLNL